MISSSCYNRLTTIFVLGAATASVLSISFMFSLQPTNAIASVNQFPQSMVAPSKLTYTSLGGDSERIDTRTSE